MRRIQKFSGFLILRPPVNGHVAYVALVAFENVNHRAVQSRRMGGDPATDGQ